MMRVLQGSLLLYGSMALAMASSASAAPSAEWNDCRVRYAVAGANGGTTGYTYTLAEGNSSDVDQGQIQWIKNELDQPLRVEITNLLVPGTRKWVELSQMGAQDPPIGFYFAPVTLHKVECLGSISYPTAEAMIANLRDVVPLNELMQSLNTVFGLAEAQIAALLLNAGLEPEAIAQALGNTFGADVADIAEWFGGFGFDVVEMAEILRQVLGTTNNMGEELAQYLFDLGYSTVEVLSVLSTGPEEAFNLLVQVGFDVSQAASAVVDGFGVTGQDIAGWLSESGVTPEAAAQLLASLFNPGSIDLGQWMSDAGYDLDAVLKAWIALGFEDQLATFTWAREQYNLTVDQLKTKLTESGFPTISVETWLASIMGIERVLTGHTRGFFGTPSTEPREPFPLTPGPNYFTLRGAALNFVTSLEGLPGGARAQIVEQSITKYENALWPYIHVWLDVPTNPGATAGSARVVVGQSPGPAFAWRVVQEEPRGEQGGLPGADGRSPDAGRGESNASGTTSDPVDLVPLELPNTFYRLGGGTTLDAEGDSFTQLDPFQGSSFCQGIPEGESTRGQLPTSNTSRITVPDVRWGVENASDFDLTADFKIELRRGGAVVASQVVRGLLSGERAEFAYQRPQSTTVVARVGPGNGCFHSGLSTEGWNDNAEYSTEVDTQDEIRERSENNNFRTLGDNNL